jgi:hypothetical protein
MRRRLVWIAVIAFAASACTKGGGDATPPPPSGQPTPSPSIVLDKGTYGWDAYGVTAVLTPQAEGWSLEIENTSGEKIGAPGIYALRSDTGARVDATVTNAQPLPNGGSATLDVTWPQDFNARDNAGMIMLVVGDSLYGGFDRGR